MDAIVLFPFCPWVSQKRACYSTLRAGTLNGKEKKRKEKCPDLLINQHAHGKKSVFTAPHPIRIPKSTPSLECRSNRMERLPSTTVIHTVLLVTVFRTVRERGREICLLECKGQAYPHL